MARGDFKQRVVFELEDQASAGVDRVQSRFSKLGSFLASRFTITLGDVVNTFRSLAGVVGDVVSAAERQEDAVRQLDQALSSLGPNAQNASEQLQAQAAALEQTTKFSDESIIANQALALNLGVSADQTAKLTQASVELSAATGRSLESSFVNLARTLNGFRGELGELVPEVATLSAENLRAGAALDVILDRLGGTAAGNVKTFSGLVTQLGNAWGTLQERLGKAITENDGIIRSLGELRDLITSDRFLDAITFIADGFVDIALAFGEAIARAARIADAIQRLSDRISSLRRQILEALGPLARFVSFLGDSLVNQITAPIRLVEQLGENVVNLADNLDGAAESTSSYTEAASASTPVIETYRDVNIAAGVAVSERADAEEIAASTTRVVGDETEFATGALLTFEDANRRVASQANQLTASLERTARAAAQVQSATGGSLTARDRRSQADVDAALAAGRQTTQGGTRIRTADGSGSRLLR